MRWQRTIGLINVHAEGEIGKVIVSGVLGIPGRTMLERLAWLQGEGDALRRFCVLEPRGSAQASVNLLLPPCEPGAQAGFIVMQADGCHAMSGSNAICVTTALLETGILPLREPATELVLDTAAGLVPVTAECRDGKVVRVSLTMPASFVDRLGLLVDVPGLGPVPVDVAFGGVFYALVDPAALGLRIEPGEARRLVELGIRILDAARTAYRPVHPERSGLAGIAYLMFCGRDAEGWRNATVLPPGRLDRSPCGTGSSARLALMHARGELAVGEPGLFRSTIGTHFEATLIGQTEVGGRPAVLPRLAGRGWIYAREEIGLDPSDPFPLGHMVADCWGPGVASLIAHD